MDTKQIEYILKIAEENNITKAAEKLYITQSALNQQLLRLEKELGTPLFHRSRTNWRPTEAGTLYIENARKILRIKKDTYNQINDLTSAKRGRLSIGFTPGRGIAMFAGVYPRFHQAYPDVIVEPVEKNVRILQQMIAEDELDIGFLTLREEDKTNDCYLTLNTEEIILVISSGHPLGELTAPAGAPLTALDICRLKYEPFVLMSKNSTMRSMVDEIFEEAGFSPYILFETANNVTILTMIQSNICCGLIPSYYINGNYEGISCFSLPSHPSWQISASYKKGRYLSDAAKYFIELAKEYWQ